MAVSKGLRGRGEVVGGERERQGGFGESCLWRCSLPRPHGAWVLGHYRSQGKSLDPWSLATSGSRVGDGKSWEDLEPLLVILGEVTRTNPLYGHNLYTIS